MRKIESIYKGIKKAIKTNNTTLLKQEIDEATRYQQIDDLFHYIARKGEPACADAVLATQHGYDFNKPFVWDKRSREADNTLLIMAVMNTNTDMVKWLIAHNADVNLTYRSQLATPLHLAIMPLVNRGYSPKIDKEINQCCEIIKLLIQSGANRDAKNLFNETPRGKIYMLSHGIKERIESVFDQIELDEVARQSQSKPDVTVL